MNVGFFLIGAQKCATTWLYHCLNEHPHIFIGGGKKETNYLGGEKYGKDSERWFKELYPLDLQEKLLGNASVEYLYDKSAAEIVYNYNPEAKIIASLRNPADRFISAYNWMVRKSEIENIGLQEAFEVALSGKDQAYHSLLERGRYYDQIKRYLDLYEAERVRILFFDHIKPYPRDVVQQLYSFLKVDNNHTPLSLKRKPKSDAGLYMLHKIEKILPNYSLMQKSMNALNEIGTFLLPKRKALSQENEALYNQLIEYYREEINKTLELVSQKQVTLLSKPVSWLNKDM